MSAVIFALEQADMQFKEDFEKIKSGSSVERFMDDDTSTCRTLNILSLSMENWYRVKSVSVFQFSISIFSVFDSQIEYIQYMSFNVGFFVNQLICQLQLWFRNVSKERPHSCKG